MNGDYLRSPEIPATTSELNIASAGYLFLKRRRFVSPGYTSDISHDKPVQWSLGDISRQKKIIAF
jgi:hypothetical protein